MKLLFSLILMICTVTAANAQVDDVKPSATASSSKIQTVEASCGECKFGMVGTGCQLAVRLDGKAYFVDGTAIDKHGDAHSENGFCNAIRKAEVNGNIVDNRFVAKSFKLLPVEELKH